MGVSWYLAVDMQLFVIAPLYIYALYRWRIGGIVFTVASLAGGVVANAVLYNDL